MPSGHVSMSFGLQGTNHSVSTAYATGTHAVGDAAAMIQRGACDVMAGPVAGGKEACIENIVMCAFHQAKAQNITKGLNLLLTRLMQREMDL